MVSTLFTKPGDFLLRDCPVFPPPAFSPYLVYLLLRVLPPLLFCCANDLLFPSPFNTFFSSFFSKCSALDLPIFSRIFYAIGLIFMTRLFHVPSRGTGTWVGGFCFSLVSLSSEFNPNTFFYSLVPSPPLVSPFSFGWFCYSFVGILPMTVTLFFFRVFTGRSCYSSVDFFLGLRFSLW